ncbi:integrase [Novosphingobium gossypii]
MLTLAEVKRLLSATTCLKHQAALSVAYGAGLRVSEVLALKVSDVDSKRMLLRIERGKGGRYRNAMLPKGLLVLLREWWRAGRQQGIMLPNGWLFPGRNATVPISTRQLYRIVVQALLGQAKLNTTAFYTQVATKTMRAVTSPLDRLMISSGGTSDG